MPATMRRESTTTLTDVDREALLERVQIVDDRVVRYREIPHQTVESVNLMLSRLEELTRPWPTFVEVLDLSSVHRPSPEVRAALSKWMKRLSPRLLHMAVVVRTNYVMRAVARFVAYSMNVREISFHDSEEQAMESARRARR
jgi:hypothetical protein